MSFRDAMEHVYKENPFPLRKRDLEHELSHPVSLGLEEKVSIFFFSVHRLSICCFIIG